MNLDGIDILALGIFGAATIGGTGLYFMARGVLKFLRSI